MHELNTEQLESIRRLLIEPVRETVRTEIQLSHDRVSAAVTKLDDRLAGHMERNEKRLAIVEKETGNIRAFRRRLAAVYAVMTLVLSLVWSIVRDKLMSKWIGR